MLQNSVIATWRKLPVAHSLRLSGLCLGWDYRILRRLGEPEFHGGFGLDLDLFTRSRVSSNPCRTLRLYEFAQARDGELSQLPGL